MQIIKSHNDENASSPVYTAFYQGARIFDVDVIYSSGKVMCAHSWRPAWMCKISFNDYLKKFTFVTSNHHINYYLQIDIKTFQMPIVNKILKEIIKLVDSRSNIFIGIYAADKWYTPGRVKVKNEILETAKAMYLETKIMDYKTMEKMIIDNGYKIITKDF